MFAKKPAEKSLVMDQPVHQSLLDHVQYPSVGKPLSRIDGPLKVSGQATYSAEYNIDAKHGTLLHGYLVSSTIGSGSVIKLHEDTALAVDGVVAVIHDPHTFARNAQQGGQEAAPTQGIEQVAYMGQPIALVVAKTFEAAREGAKALLVDYKTHDGVFDFDQALPDKQPIAGGSDGPQQQHQPEQALANAAVSVDLTFTTPSQNSAAMEPHATIAYWEGDQLVLHSSMQMLASCRKQIADALKLKPEQVRLVARFVGGGFGSKLGISPESIAAALAAKQLGQPVKVVMSRPQVFEATVRRTNTLQRVALGADADGHLHTVIHNSVSSNLPDEIFYEPCALATKFLYAGQNRQARYDMVRMNLGLSGSMRAPGEAVGLIALECAMDELAEKLHLDPIELRRRNDPSVNPSEDTPFSSRSLTAALTQGAQSFGWDKRNPKPAQQRDGDWLIGMGVASAARSNLLNPSQAQVTLNPDGTAVVCTDMTDIGTGSYTIFAQIAADLLGLPVDQIQVKLGDTDFPPAAGSGGSWGATSAGSSIYVACQQVREMLAKQAGIDLDQLALRDGQVLGGKAPKALADVIKKPLVALGKIDQGKMNKDYSQAAYGAHFAEVGVHVVTGEIRVRRMLGVFAAGRILNEKTARSQCYGGMTFGIGSALMEHLMHDSRDGRVINHDLAEYHVPVNADVPSLEVEFITERDPYANPLQAKGIGELGIAGAGAAIANAVYHATGKRIYDFPITLDKVLDALPAL